MFGRDWNSSYFPSVLIRNRLTVNLLGHFVMDDEHRYLVRAVAPYTDTYGPDLLGSLICSMYVVCLFGVLHNSYFRRLYGVSLVSSYHSRPLQERGLEWESMIVWYGKHYATKDPLGTKAIVGGLLSV